MLHPKVYIDMSACAFEGLGLLCGPHLTIEGELSHSISGIVEVRV